MGVWKVSAYILSLSFSLLDLPGRATISDQPLPRTRLHILQVERLRIRPIDLTAPRPEVRPLLQAPVGHFLGRGLTDFQRGQGTHLRNAFREIQVEHFKDDIAWAPRKLR